MVVCTLPIKKSTFIMKKAKAERILILTCSVFVSFIICNNCIGDLFQKKGIFRNIFFRKILISFNSLIKNKLSELKYLKTSKYSFNALFNKKQIILSTVSIRNKDSAPKKCPPNSTKCVEGSCICKDGFVGFPHDKRGCFKCEPTCYEDETCIYPGICGCMFGQMRAENNECLAPSLRISNAYPAVIDRQFNGKIYVEIVPKEITIRPLFCKFGQVILSAGKGRKPGEIVCGTPLIKKLGNAMLYVSDSRTQWPAHGILIRVKKTMGTDFTSNAISGTLVSVLICILLYITSYKFFKSETGKYTRWRNDFENQKPYIQFS
jgi:hypothetical protein